MIMMIDYINYVNYEQLWGQVFNLDIYSLK